VPAPARGPRGLFTAPERRIEGSRPSHVEEVWYVTSGRGRMWRKLGDDEQIVELAPGVSLTIPIGTCFQFRCDGDEALDVIGATMPPWPGEGEAFFVDGTWYPTL